MRSEEKLLLISVFKMKIKNSKACECGIIAVKFILLKDKIPWYKLIIIYM